MLKVNLFWQSWPGQCRDSGKPPPIPFVQRRWSWQT